MSASEDTAPAPPPTPLGATPAAAAELIVPYAASRSPRSRETLAQLRLTNLDRLLRRLAVQARDTQDSADEAGLDLPHERAQARALGVAASPGQTPWAAVAARAAGLPHEDGTPWAWVTPCHWDVGMDRVVLINPADLALDDTASRALLAAMAPYFAEDGLTLQHHAPGRWLAHGAPLRGLATPSLDRVIGQDIAPWLQRAGLPPALRRLQSEMQMLLYTHGVNDARTAQRALPVNAFWLSGAGALPAGWTLPPRPPVVPQALREAALREDWAAWQSAWQQLDGTDVAAWLARAEAGEPVALTLTSELAGVTLRPRAPGLGGWIASTFRPLSASHLLSSL